MDILKWKRDYGDGYETDDSVLWINGEPSDLVVSGNPGCWFAYYGCEEIGIYDTMKDAKDSLLAII